MRHVWLVVEEGEGFPWSGYTPRDHGILSRQSLGQSLDALALSLSELELASAGAARMLGVPEPENLARSRWLLERLPAGREKSLSPKRLAYRRRHTGTDRAMPATTRTSANVTEASARLYRQLTGNTSLVYRKRHRRCSRIILVRYRGLQAHRNCRLVGVCLPNGKAVATVLADTAHLCKKWHIDANMLAQAFGMPVRGEHRSGAGLGGTCLPVWIGGSARCSLGLIPLDCAWYATSFRATSLTSSPTMRNGPSFRRSTTSLYSSLTWTCFLRSLQESIRGRSDGYCLDTIAPAAMLEGPPAQAAFRLRSRAI